MSRLGLCAALISVVACSSEESPVVVTSPPAAAGDAGAAPDGARAPATLAPLRGFDLGPLECGTTQRGAIAIPAPPDAKLTWRASVQPADFFMIDGSAQGELSPGDVQILNVRAEAVADKVLPGESVRGIVHIETDHPSAKSVDLPVSFTPQGARIEAPTRIDFGLVASAAPAPTMKTTVRNIGSRSVLVPLAGVSASPFAITASDPIADLDPGEELEIPVQFQAQAPGSYRATLPLELRGVVCGPKSLALDVAAYAYGGTVSVNPGSITLAPSPCNASPGTETITLTNYGATPVSWTSAWGANTFAVSPTFGTLNAGTSATLTVSRTTPSALPNEATDTLSLSVGNDTLKIPVVHKTNGAVVRVLGGSPVNVPDARLNSIVTNAITLVNDGNEPVTINPEGTEAFTVSPGLRTIAPQSSLSLNVNFRATQLGSRSGSVTLHESATCQPTTVALTGYAYAKVKSVWANRSLTEGYYDPSYYCFELDDGGLYCNGAHLGVYAGTAKLLPDMLGDTPCILPSGTTIPSCGTPFTPAPTYAGFSQASWYGPWLATDGRITVDSGATFVANLSDVTRVAGTPTHRCVVRKTGAAECWSPYSSNLLQAIDGGSHNTPETRVAIPGIDDAVDLVHRSLYDYPYYGDMLWILRASGKVSRVFVEDSKVVIDTLPGISDAVEIRTRDSRLAIRRSSGLVSWLSLETRNAQPQLLPWSDIRAIALGDYYSRWMLVSGDGRVLGGTSLDSLSPRPGFDR